MLARLTPADCRAVAANATWGCEYELSLASEYNGGQNGLDSAIGSLLIPLAAYRELSR